MGANREPAAVELVPLPSRGRVFRSSRRARVGDLDARGRLRLDAIARYLQDLSNDDTVDAALDEAQTWVVRRALIEVRRPARFREELSLATFCSGLGSRWAERRIVVEGEHGARVDAAVLWVRVDPRSGRPVPVGEDFATRFGSAAAGREVSARLLLPTTVTPGARVLPWTTRVADFDLLGHVNNAVAWELVEEAMSVLASPAARLRAEVEYRAPIVAGAEVLLSVSEEQGGVDMWAGPTDEPSRFLAGRVRPLP